MELTVVSDLSAARQRAGQRPAPPPRASMRTTGGHRFVMGRDEDGEPVIGCLKCRETRATAAPVCPGWSCWSCGDPTERPTTRYCRACREARDRWANDPRAVFVLGRPA